VDERAIIARDHKNAALVEFFDSVKTLMKCGFFAISRKESKRSRVRGRTITRTDAAALRGRRECHHLPVEKFLLSTRFRPFAGRDATKNERIGQK